MEINKKNLKIDSNEANRTFYCYDKKLIRGNYCRIFFSFCVLWFNVSFFATDLLSDLSTNWFLIEYRPELDMIQGL